MMRIGNRADGMPLLMKQSLEVTAAARTLTRISPLLQVGLSTSRTSSICGGPYRLQTAAFIAFENRYAACACSVSI